MSHATHVKLTFLLWNHRGKCDSFSELTVKFERRTEVGCLASGAGAGRAQSMKEALNLNLGHMSGRISIVMFRGPGF